jgi:PKD repeat protein
MSTCGSGSCTYSWNFGDGSTGSGVTVSRVYDAASSYTVTLTVAEPAYGLSSSNTVPVTATAINLTPSASFTGPTVTGMNVSLTDTSTDDGGASNLAVFVSWGDGTSSTGVGGGTLAHTYALAGTYTIKHSVTDSGGLKSFSPNATVTVTTPKYTVSGTITRSGAPFANVTVYLKQNGVTKKTTLTGTTGAYTFTSVLAGTYTVVPVKTGYTFTPTGSPTVTVGPSASGVDFTAAP